MTDKDAKINRPGPYGEPLKPWEVTAAHPLYPHQQGWLCPACGRGNAPFVHTCPCGPKVNMTYGSGT